MSTPPTPTDTPSYPAPPPPPRVIGAWRLGARVGAGSYATVFRATHVDTGACAAVKEVATDRLPPKLAAGVEREVGALQACASSPHVLQLFDVVRAPGRVFIITEYCPGGDVASLLRAGGPLPERAARALGVQLAAGLAALRARSIVHRDLKPHNLLLVPPPTARAGTSDAAPSGPTLKIADFGFARVLGASGGRGGDLADTLCGSPLYMAPEILRHQRYDAKADMWSVGAILYELVAGVPPYGGGNHVALLRDIDSRRASLPPSVAAAASPALASLLDGLLRRNPVERLSFDEFYGHEWLRGRVGGGGLALPPPPPLPATLPAFADHVPPLTPPRTATTASEGTDYVFVDASASTVAGAAAAVSAPRAAPRGGATTHTSLAAAARVAASPLLAAGAGLLLRRLPTARASPTAREGGVPPVVREPVAAAAPGAPSAAALLSGAAALEEAAAHAAAAGRSADALSLRVAALQALAAVASGRAAGADSGARAAAAARGVALAALASAAPPPQPTATLPSPWDLAYAAALADARAGAAGEVSGGGGGSATRAFTRASALLTLLALEGNSDAVFDPPPRLAAARAAAAAAVAAAVAERVAAGA